ncbi:GTPase-activating Rap/Ran-GAP domain-like protein 3 isoform X2 [Paramacrobiotus metropolitanus]|uniref:GTPase-activating Rap/Ran-GAP domain-like protein 3 isoform X2 n=1 Tax=Paramacrobiotus metropolitanus TaxID=2943436 RepID=UPI002445B38D|nr:GTPase-activating Rap/Ran-GAP domain-like protein 3 isoform X2 [Paramacrobiotus metropolitanus]
MNTTGNDLKLSQESLKRSGSLDELRPDERSFREKPGLLRRVFTGSRRKKGKKFIANLQLSPLGADSSFLPNSSESPGSSPSADLSIRRGVFSRRHYGSVELLARRADDVDEGSRFRVENGERRGRETDSYHSPSTPLLENPEYQTRWYFKYFLGRHHQNYIGMDSDKNPFVLSILLSDANDHQIQQYRAILWRRTGTEKICLPYNPGKPLTVRSVLGCFSRMHKIEKGPKEILTPSILKDLLVLEEQEGSVNFKFGVIYAMSGQTADNEMFSNKTGSDTFSKFVSLLGDRVKLKSWDRYRGGLDTKSDTTGTESIYTVYEGHEIMFHISTLLPYSSDNPQQVERKRHIGNDIVNIVFWDCPPGEQPTFSPQMVKSQFTHVFAVVSWDAENRAYRLQVFSEESVPLFGPPLPVPSLFYDFQEFREFLIVKCINGEKAAFNTPTFAQKRERTLDSLLRDLYAEHMHGDNRVMLSRRAFSDALVEPSLTSKSTNKKEEARQVEFSRIGQALKLDTIMKGDAPTSLATSSSSKKEPWQPQCFFPDFAYEIICGDSWGSERLIIATETAGAFVIEEGMLPHPIFERSAIIRQIAVVEDHGILIARMDKGKESRLYVFRLKDFETEPTAFYTKSDCKDHKLEGSKGCLFFTLNRPGGNYLRMAIAMNRKIILMQWKHSIAYSALCPHEDTINGFVPLQELSLNETPVLISLIDGVNGPENKVCVGYRNSFDLINERTGEVISLYQTEAGKTNLVAALDVCEDDEKELLLCYHNTCHFQKLDGSHNTEEFDFQWCSVPENIVCASPYVIAFNAEGLEIRLLINGNLVYSGTMPEMKLITSKTDIFFATTAPEFYPWPTASGGREGAVLISKENTPSGSGLSSPNSPNTAKKPFRIYKVSIRALTGQWKKEPNGSRTMPASPNLSHRMAHHNAPSIQIPDNLSDRDSPSPRLYENTRLGLPRTKHRTDTASTDSGVPTSYNSVSSTSSPPASPV